MSQVMLLLTDGRTDRIWEISVALGEAWRQWQSRSDLVPVIEVHGDDESFPFELLPLLSIDEIEGEFANVAEAEDALLGFIGFGACIRRTLGEEVLGDLVGGPKIPVQVFVYDDLKGARAELTDVFRDLADVTVDGPWPGAGLDTDTVRRQLIDALFDPEVDLDGKRTAGTPVQIQHFACHCGTASQTGSGYLLKLGGDTSPHPVTLANIGQGFFTLLKKHGPIHAARPLVVANACGSAKIDVAGRRSFPMWFLNQHHRGFIGTETDVEDSVAASFSRFLYEEFIGDRKPLGEAVVLARRRLLTERNSPHGLLYTFYGDPDLGIVQASIASA
jgi:hypothetical protein